MSPHLQRVISWPGRFIAWLQEEEARLTYKFVFPILLTGSICWLIFDTPEARIRWTGLVLQLLGLLMVVIGLSEARKRFGRPSILDAARRYLSRFPTLKQRNVTAHVSGAAGIVAGGSAMIGHGTVAPGPNTPLEERVARLEQSVKRIDGDLFQANQRIEREAATRKEAIAAERSARETGDAEIRKRLEDEVVGGLHLETMGAWWIALGILLASGSMEFSRLL